MPSERVRKRPKRISREAIDQIVSAVSKSVPTNVAARAAGVDPRTIYRWLQRAEEQGGLYAEFKERYEEAEAQSNVDLIDVIRTQAVVNKDWKAAQYLLMARLPEYFNTWRDRAVHHRHEHTGIDGGPIEHQVTADAKIEAVIAALTPETLDVLVSRLINAGYGGSPPALTEGNGSEEVSSVHQVLIPRVPGDATLREVSRSPGISSEWEDQETSDIDAPEAWEEPS